jgi:hypothetical protein
MQATIEPWAGVFEARRLRMLLAVAAAELAGCGGGCGGHRMTGVANPSSASTSSSAPPPLAAEGADSSARVSVIGSDAGAALHGSPALLSSVG